LSPENTACKLAALLHSWTCINRDAKLTNNFQHKPLTRDIISYSCNKDRELMQTQFGCYWSLDSATVTHSIQQPVVRHTQQTRIN